MKYLFFTLFALLLSCSQAENKQLEKDDPTTELLSQLEEADSLLASAPFEELIALREEVDDRYWWFYHEFTDTSDRDFWVYELSDLQRIHKGIGNAEKEPEELKKSIDYSMEQLADLKMAYETGELDSSSFFVYLMDEEAATEAVVNRSRYRSNETQLCIAKWEILRPKLDSTRSFHTDRSE